MAAVPVPRVWKCQKCGSTYALLFELVAHVRAVHSGDSHLNLTCQVNGCPRSYNNTNSWYKHVRNAHRDEYFNKDIEIEMSTIELSQSEKQDMDDRSEEDGLRDGDRTSDDINNDPESSTEPSFVSQHAATGMLLKVKEKHRLSQAAVEEVIQVVGVITDHVVTETLSAVTKSGEAHGMDVDTPFFRNLPRIAENTTNPLSKLETAYRQQSYVTRNFPYVEPVWCEIGTHVGTIGRNVTPTNVSDGFYYVPFLQTLEVLLNNTDVFNQVMSGMHRASSTDLMMDICDGDLFDSHQLFQGNEKALQVIGYYDEVTLTNPIGSRAKKHKIGAIYFMLGNIDPALRSRLESINLVALFRSELLQQYSFDAIIKPFISDVKKLSAPGGCSMTIQGCHYNIEGALVAFVGDTPAVNMAGGFKEGVGQAMRKCRHCLATYAQIQTKFVEEEFQARNMHQHTQHCSYINQLGISESERQHYSKVYGVNRRSILCDLPSFDVTQQLPQDLMHILLEGVFQIQIRELLKYLVERLSFMTFADINSRILSYRYAYFEEKPAPLTTFDTHGSQSAAQMWELFNILPFLVGKRFPPCNPHYECFMLLNDIATILFSPVIARDQIAFLRVQIQQYLEKFTSLHPHQPLTPKFHFLVHVPSLINRYGPLVHLWSMRFEGKHKQFKAAARSTSFKNILKTLSQHHQRLLAYNLQCNSSYASVTLSTGATTKLDLTPFTPHVQYIEAIRESYPNLLLQRDLHRCKSVTILGTLYKAEKCCLMIGTTELPFGTVPQFGLLYDIIVQPQSSHEPSVYFVFMVMDTVSYDPILGAYKVKQLQKYKCLYRSFVSNSCYHPFNAVEHCGSLYIKFKYDLSVYCNY